MHVIASLTGYGAEHFVVGLLPLLAEAGDEVAVLTVYSAKGTRAAACADVPVFDAARVSRTDAAFFSRMVKAMRDFKPDIVHTHMHNGKYWGRLAALAAGVRYIVHTEHDPNFRVFGMERAAAAVLARRTARFIAFSRGHGERLANAEGIPPDKITVIPNGIALRAIAPDARSRGRRLLETADGELAVVMVGRLEEQKNHELALRAFAALPAELRRRAKLYVIGDGSLGPALRSLAEESAISDSVAFMGFRSDAFELLAGADVMLMTSRREAMPIALIESMMLAVPTASAPWAGVEEMLDGDKLGYISKTFTPDDVAQTIAAALADPRAAHAKAAAAQAKAVAEYDVRVSARRHAELYHSLVGAR